MTRYWTSRPEAKIPAMQDDMQMLTLNVLASAAFRESYDFRGSEESRSTSSDVENYRDALLVIHERILYLMLVPLRILTGPMMPRSLAKVGQAAMALEKFMLNMVGEERAAIDRGELGSGGLVTQLVRAQQTTMQSKLGDIAKSDKGALSTDEILGNLFVINIAGYDTTSITLAFLVMLLAANPDVQDWLSEEITAFAQNKPVEEWTYDLFPKLKRCRAVVYETLRLYSPISGNPKITSGRVQHLRVGDWELAIPPGTEVISLIHSVQADPRYWPGGDARIWRPSRWIVRPEPAAENPCEELFVPYKGSFCPWADGAQGCIGKKFSQVEAVAALACIFKDFRVRPKLEAGETLEQARQRAEECANDVNYQFMLRMNDPSQVKLECIRA